MKTYASFCDLCLGEGVIRLAIAKYWNDEGKEYHTCNAHLSDVRQVDLEYEKFDALGNVNEEY